MAKKYKVKCVLKLKENGEIVDSMSVKINGITLSAECHCDDIFGGTAGYGQLVEMITEQAKEKGIAPNRLKF